MKTTARFRFPLCWSCVSLASLLLWCCASGCSNKTSERPTVTFVLGVDHYDVNPYYTNALQYYRQNTQTHPGTLITHCHSLREVCDYLAQHKPGKKPWGTINLVAHGNAWTGMSLPIFPGDSSRTSVETLSAAEADGQLLPLPDAVLDRHSTIRLQSCALGLDTALLLTLSQVLGGADRDCPKVVSTRLFNQYEPEGSEMQHSLAEFWFTTYPTYQRPPLDTLAGALANKYPKTDLDWVEALHHRRPRWAGDPYWKPVVVPIHWAVTYPDSATRPHLRSPEDQQHWLAAQPELQAAIARLGLPAGQFRWEFREETLSFPDGAREPAILAEGQTTVCCVLRKARQSGLETDFYTTAQYQKPDNYLAYLTRCLTTSNP